MPDVEFGVVWSRSRPSLFPTEILLTQHYYTRKRRFVFVFCLRFSSLCLVEAVGFAGLAQL